MDAHGASAIHLALPNVRKQCMFIKSSSPNVNVFGKRAAYTRGRSSGEPSSRDMGSPSGYSVFLDEEMNRRLAAVCRSAHSQVFEARVLDTFGWAYGLTDRDHFKRRRL